MIKSMTGFGSAAREFDNRKISVEIKSVNHRYSDFTLKAPRACAFLDDPVRAALSGYISRGKVDVFISIDVFEEAAGAVRVNHALAESYLRALRDIADTYGLAENISPVSLAQFPDVLRTDKAEEDAAKLTEEVLEVLRGAAESHDAMRVIEGEKLKNDMAQRLSALSCGAEEIEARAPQIVAQYRERIEARVREILGETPFDEGRLLTEVAVFADRVDVNEELVRLKSHISQMSDMLSSKQSIGRKLDFLIQEMNREINTIGSKTNDLSAARIVIDLKAELEKLREQAQNVE